MPSWARAMYRAIGPDSRVIDVAQKSLDVTWKGLHVANCSLRGKSRRRSTELSVGFARERGMLGISPACPEVTFGFARNYCITKRARVIGKVGWRRNVAPRTNPTQRPHATPNSQSFTPHLPPTPGRRFNPGTRGIHPHPFSTAHRRHLIRRKYSRFLRREMPSITARPPSSKTTINPLQVPVDVGRLIYDARDSQPDV